MRLWFALHTPHVMYPLPLVQQFLPGKAETRPRQQTPANLTSGLVAAV
jgi:hypothetical protein